MDYNGCVVEEHAIDPCGVLGANFPSGLAISAKTNERLLESKVAKESILKVEQERWIRLGSV